MTPAPDKTVEVSQAARDAAAVREALGRKYLLLASYCDGENAPCTDARPCDACLAMCNVFRLAEHGMSFVGELGSALQSTTRATQPEAALREALEAIRDLQPEPFNFPADWQEQIAACEECKRYEGHPIQRGICDTHRRPLWNREKHDRHQEALVGYRAKSIAADAIAALEDHRHG